MGVWFFIIILLCVLFVLWLMRGVHEEVYANVKEGNVDEFNRLVEEFNLTEANIKEHIRFNNKCGSLIYTNDNRLFLLEKDNSNYLKFKIKKIEIKDILDISIDISFMEKNRMQIIALTPTFNNYKKINSANLKIITDSEIYNLDKDNNSVVFSDDYILFKQKAVDDCDLVCTLDKMKKIKLLVEKQIKIN